MRESSSRKSRQDLRWQSSFSCHVSINADAAYAYNLLQAATTRQRIIDLLAIWIILLGTRGGDTTDNCYHHNTQDDTTRRLPRCYETMLDDL